MTPPPIKGAALIATAAAGAVLAGCGSTEKADPNATLVLGAAASLSKAFANCSGEYTDATVRGTYAGSDVLAEQIRRGVAIDLYAAANSKLPQQLYREGLVDKPVAFATNELVLAVPAEGAKISSFGQLAGADLKLAAGDSTVPVGSYTDGALAKLPDAERRAIQAQIKTREPDVASVVGKLLTGTVDAAFVYRTDVQSANGKLAVVELPELMKPKVVYQAAVVKASKRAVQAKGLLEDITDGSCASALKSSGFGEPPK